MLVEMAASVHPGRIPVDAVLGNVDLINREISDFPADAGVKVHGRFADLTLHDKRVAVVHGDDRRQLEEAIASGRYDYLLTGHTHVADDRMGGRTRVINPGAVYRAASPSVATLHLATGRLRRYELAN